MLGIRIMQLRTERGLSQGQLAEKLHFSTSTVGMYEQGRRTPGIDALIALAEVFQVSLDYLITGAEFSPKDPDTAAPEESVENPFIRNRTYRRPCPLLLPQMQKYCHHLAPPQHNFTDMILGGNEMDKAALGQKLREVRLKKGYTQQALAGEAGIGIMYLSEIERGLKMPSLNSFIQLIEALDISADYVLREELTTGQEYVFDELTEKLKNLTPKQRKTATDILDAYIKNLD